MCHNIPNLLPNKSAHIPFLYHVWQRAPERSPGDQEVHLEHVDGGHDRDVAAEQPYLLKCYSEVQISYMRLHRTIKEEFMHHHRKICTSKQSGLALLYLQ